NRHPRVKILSPGPGVGGHCISVDPWFLVEAAPETAQLIRTAREVNDSQPQYVADFMRKKLGDLKGKWITVLGLAYKPDVDDLRESPAVDTAVLLANAGAVVTAYEPYKTDFKLDGITTVDILVEAVEHADILLLLVGHIHFKSMDPLEIAKISKARQVVDTVNGWKRSEWESAGFEFFRIGDGKN
ncbi:MAG TPA: UDP binding domain-containing protein, partial [Pelolinea sp.]|nr:UDP binding domain-containing protein [Pelolinea sp.]